MAWDDVPAKMAQYDAEEYADNSGDTTASEKLLFEYNAVDLAGVPVNRRDDFEKDLNYRIGACINLRNSRGWRRDKLNKV